jgi:acyl-CoA thioesterase-2
MHAVLDDLITLLKLERIEDNIFRGDSRDIGSAQVFGGQVLGQALSAAQHTVEDRVAHSLHAYFLRRGDMNAPIVYEVDRARDGGSFSTRRIVAIQHGRPIFNLAASFQKPEPGLDHQAEKPAVIGPEGLRDLAEIACEHIDKLPEKLRRFMTDKRPFEFRPVEPVALGAREPQPPVKHVWIRAVDTLPDDVALHQNLLAYVSDCPARADLRAASFSTPMETWWHRLRRKGLCASSRNPERRAATRVCRYKSQGVFGASCAL